MKHVYVPYLWLLLLLSNFAAYAQAPIGQTIWLKGNNDQYVSSNADVATAPQQDMWSNRPRIGNWELFLVVNAGNGQIALYNRGYYVSGETTTGRMVCNRTVVGPWEKFDWISNADGTISLRAKALRMGNGA